MNCRKCLVAAILAVGMAALCGVAEPVRAETIAVDDGIAVKDSGLPTPSRGMTMKDVAARFGAPSAKLGAVGQPPISRWKYPGFVVYFEREYVIHSVVANS